MTSFDYESLPKGIFADANPGWPFLAKIFGVETMPAPTMSTIGKAEVPSAFELFLGDPENWYAVLLFRVRDGEILLENVSGIHVEADKALANALSIRPLGWWKKFALQHVFLASIADGIADLDDDAPDRSEKLAFYRDQAITYSAWKEQPVATSRHRGRVTESKLREVAGVYRKALEDGRGPTRAVEEHFKVSYSTAARWVGMARKVKGGLGPSLGFKAGEQTDGK